jgi:hypothetical protein
LGLAEYEYSLALQAIDLNNPMLALDHFAYAVTYRPGIWSNEFYTKYQNALAKVDAERASHVTFERSTSPSLSAQVRVGRRDIEHWEGVIPVYKDWALQGYTLRTPIALELGFPIVIDMFWINTLGQTKRDTITTWNRISNGGMELHNQNAVIGWFQSTIKFDTYTWATRYKVQLDKYETNVLEGLLAADGNYDVKMTRPIHVAPSSKILWSMRVDGDPQVNVYWLDIHKMIVGSDTLLDGARGVPIYSSVVNVPADASYLVLLLLNARTTRKIFWDYVLVIPLEPLQAK